MPARETSFDRYAQLRTRVRPSGGSDWQMNGREAAEGALRAAANAVGLLADADLLVDAVGFEYSIVAHARLFSWLGSLSCSDLIFASGRRALVFGGSGTRRG
jgi:hypothetical protein